VAESKESNKTLWVAIAGISATALVGLAGTAGAWWSARDDRAAQRALARDERTYDRRVSAYLDAIDFVEEQKNSVSTFFWAKRAVTDPRFGPLDPSLYGEIPYQLDPPNDLVARLRAFGSATVVREFQKTQSANQKIPIRIKATGRPTLSSLTAFGLTFRPSRGPTRVSIDFKNTRLTGKLAQAMFAFEKQIERFENVVHREVG
jgi:hypothetical protein